MFIYLHGGGGGVGSENHRHCGRVTDPALDEGLYENFGNNDCSTEERKTRIFVRLN